MEIQSILKNLRKKNNLTQEQLAERVQVTRQAVSRWETGETQPNTDTLKLLSRVFDVSINTLLGSPRQLVCQCCGVTPKFCVKSIERRNRAKFICRRQRLDRLPPISTT